MRQQLTVEYRERKEFSKDRAHWLADGWHVVSVTEMKAGARAANVEGRKLPGWLITPKSHVFVTYEKS